MSGVRNSVAGVIDTATERPNAHRRSYELLGDALVDVSDVAQARQAYAKAGAFEKLRAIGAYDIADKIERRRTKRRPMDLSRIVVGDELVASGNYRKAIAAYRDAGAHDKLIELGDSLCARGDRLIDAHSAYVAAGAVDRLRQLGQLFEERGRFDSALRSFIAAGDRDAAEGIGDAIFHASTTAGELHSVLEAYRYARARGKLVQLGRKYVELGAIADALSAFRAAARLEEQ